MSAIFSNLVRVSCTVVSWFTRGTLPKSISAKILTNTSWRTLGWLGVFPTHGTRCKTKKNGKMECLHGRSGLAGLRCESNVRMQNEDGVYLAFLRRAEAEPRLEMHTQQQRTSPWPDRDGAHASQMPHAGSLHLRGKPKQREELSLDDATDWSSQQYQTYSVTDTLEWVFCAQPFIWRSPSPSMPMHTSIADVRLSMLCASVTLMFLHRMSLRLEAQCQGQARSIWLEQPDNIKSRVTLDRPYERTTAWIPWLCVFCLWLCLSAAQGMNASLHNNILPSACRTSDRLHDHTLTAHSLPSFVY